MRKLSFSIRHLLVLIAFFATVTAIVAKIGIEISRERSAANRMADAKCQVTWETVGLLPGGLNRRVTSVEIDSLIAVPDYNPVDDLVLLCKLQSLRIAPIDARDEQLRGLRNVSHDLRELRVWAHGSQSLMSVAARFEQLEVLSLLRTPVSHADIQQLRALPHLTTLELSSNQISDRNLPIICELSSLRRLELKSTSIEGRTLDSMKDLTRLETLQISVPVQPQPSGEEILGPELMEGLAQLKPVRGAVQRAPVSESLQSGTEARPGAKPFMLNLLPILPLLRTLSLGGCRFDKDAIEIIGRQPKLGELNLSYCTFPSELSKTAIGSWKIRTLRLTLCEDTRELISEAAKIGTIRSLSIHDPQIAFGDLAPLADLPDLESLVLTGVKNDGQIALLRGFPAIESLVLWGSDLTDAERTGLSNLRRIQIYDFIPPPGL